MKPRRILSLSLAAALLAGAPLCQQSRTTILGTTGNLASYSSAQWITARGSGDVIGVHSSSPIPVLAVAAHPVVLVTDVPGTDAQVDAAVASVPAILAAGDIRVWCVGNEIETVAGAEMAARANRVVAAIKAAKPSITTCVVFQYERARLIPDIVLRAKLFTADALGATVYPGAAGGFTSAAAVPAGYLNSLESWATQASKSYGITELGWSGVNPSDQQLFIKRALGGELGGKGARWLDWFSLYDFGSVAQAPFDRMGLYDASGVARPALAVWQQALAVPMK